MSALTTEQIDDIAVIVLEDPNHVSCAEYIINEYPQATKAELTAILDECERGLRSMRLGDLSALRKELENGHDAWGSA